MNKFNKTKNSIVSKLEESQPFPSPVDSNKNMGAVGPRDTQQNEMVDSSVSVVSLSMVFASGSQFSSLDPLSSPSQDLPPHNVVDSIRSEVGSNHILVEQNADNPCGVGKKQDLETTQTTSPRPSSDHHIRPQEIVPHNGKFDEGMPSCMLLNLSRKTGKLELTMALYAVKLSRLFCL